MKNRVEGSPYNILDGKWGGFGPSYWSAGIDTENPLNVFERKAGPNNELLCVWDNESGEWRQPTEYEGLLWEDVTKPITMVPGNFSKGEMHVFGSSDKGYSRTFGKK